MDQPTGSTRAPWDAPAEDERRPPRSRSSRFLLVSVLLVFGVIGLVLATGGKIVGLHFGTEGVGLEFSHSTVGDEVDEESLSEAQPELESRIEDLEEQMQSQGSQPAPSVTDLSGVWQGDNGLTYRIQQYGTEVVWSEESLQYGVTAVGYGEFDGSVLSIDYQVFDGTTGYVELTFDGVSLSGVFSNGTPITMT